MFLTGTEGPHSGWRASFGVERALTRGGGPLGPQIGWRQIAATNLRARRPATPKRSAHAPGSPPLACQWLSAHAPGSPPLACQWLRLWRVREQFCRRAPCAPQGKANASHKVKRFQKRCRGRSRGSESLVRITPLSPAIGNAFDGERKVRITPLSQAIGEAADEKD